MDQFEFEKKKKKKLRKEPIFAILCVLCLIIGGCGGYFLSSLQQNQQITGTSQIYDQLAETIEEKFLDTTDSEYTLQERMLSGLVAALGDKHSSYLTSEATDDLNTSINGSYKGIGVSFSAIDSGGLILEVFGDSPASQSGLLAGDIITSIQETSIAGFDSDKIKSMIVGEQGTNVSLKVLRNGKEKTITVTRGDVESSVSYEIKTENNKKVGYLRLTTFGSTATSLAEKALKEFKKENVQNICIDLRGNGGGYIDAAQSLLDLFIPKNQIMFKVQYKDNTYQEYKSTDCDKYIFEHGYVLVNGSSASAAEVMTSALDEILDYKIIGETTYGKGTVQTQYPLSDGSTLKLTTAKWLTSKGTWINQKGIAPDYEITNETMSSYYVNALENSYQYDQVDDEIENMQKILKTLGYSVDRTDGYFSLKTQEAFKQFEKDNGLNVNGIYDQEDQKILLSCLTYYIYQKADDAQYQKVVSLLK